MPPGHGKSHYHNKLPGLVEADSVYCYRGDKELSILRTIARLTGQWEEYDKQWAARTLARLEGNLWIVMVPSVSVGQNLGGQLLTKIQLDDKQWAENLKSRNKTIIDYEYARLHGDDVHHFGTNLEVESWMQDIIKAWFLTLPEENSDSY